MVASNKQWILRNPEKWRKLYEKSRDNPLFKEQRKQWAKKNPIAIREARLRHDRKKKYSLEEGEYETLLSSQGGVCAICGESQLRRALAVDHNHNSGKVRGLLCDKCNLGIGLFGDSVIRLQRAVSYISERGSYAAAD